MGDAVEAAEAAVPVPAAALEQAVARSVEAKAELVKRYGLHGLSIWALGYGDPPVWDALRRVLK